MSRRRWIRSGYCGLLGMWLRGLLASFPGPGKTGIRPPGNEQVDGDVLCVSQIKRQVFCEGLDGCFGGVVGGVGGGVGDALFGAGYYD